MTSRAEHTPEAVEWDLTNRGQYEEIAARLLFGDAEEHSMLVVTSAVPGEGVTTTAIGIALALAESTTNRVALVDANLRDPALHLAFGVDQHPGLHDLISDPVPTRVSNLYLLPSGATMYNPTQLLTSKPAQTALRLISTQFHYVVVDCPPLLTAVEAGSICRLASGIVLVVRAGITPRDDVIRARRRLEGAPIMGVVLNGM